MTDQPLDLRSQNELRQQIGNMREAYHDYHQAIAKGAPGTCFGNILNIEKYAARVAFECGAWPDEPFQVTPQMPHAEVLLTRKADGMACKPRLLIIDKLQQFSGVLARDLGEWYNVKTIPTPEPGFIGLADVIWCEWVDDNAAQVSMVARPEKVVFTRLHGYEAIEADYPARVNWENMDYLVGVSNQMLEHLEAAFGEIPCPKGKIPNALDLERFPFRERKRPKHGGQIAWVSLLNNKKNIHTLVMAARELPEYQFHVCGKWQDVRLQKYYEHMTRTMGVDNLIYAGWSSDVAGFLADKDFLLNASLWESFSFACHEAMAMGIKPLVHTWVGWEEFFPRDMVWADFGELKRLLRGNYNSNRYRRMAEQYDSKKVAVMFREMIEGIRESKAAVPVSGESDDAIRNLA